VRALARFPELVGLGQATIVPAAQLPAFESGVLATTGGAEGSFTIVPPGNRPFYCFGTAGIARSATAGLPLGFDYCSGAIGTAGFAACDSGEGAYIPLTVPAATGTASYLVVLSPVYRGGGPAPATVTARQDSFVGWLGMEVVPAVVLARALQNDPGNALTFTYRRARPMRPSPAAPR